MSISITKTKNEVLRDIAQLRHLTPHILIHMSILTHFPEREA